MNWIAQSLGIVTSNVSLPGWIVLAGAVIGAIFVFLLLVRSEPNENPLTLLVLIGILLGGMGVGTAILREVKTSHVVAEARDLEARATALDSAAAQAGLGCLNADEALEASCEVALFERPENVAAARGLVRARFALVEDAFGYAHQRKAPAILERVAVWRRPLERDPYGLVASVMLERRNCTASSCPELAFIGDLRQITANMNDNRYGTLVAKYQVMWDRVARNRGVYVSSGRTGPFGFAIVDHGQQVPNAASDSPAPTPPAPPANVPAESPPPGQGAAVSPAPSQDLTPTVPTAEAPLPPQRPPVGATTTATQRRPPRPLVPRPTPTQAPPPGQASPPPVAEPTPEPAPAQ